MCKTCIAWTCALRGAVQCAQPLECPLLLAAYLPTSAELSMHERKTRYSQLCNISEESDAQRTMQCTLISHQPEPSQSVKKVESQNAENDARDSSREREKANTGFC
ncbi:hypothetical protein BDV06DRAFT_201764 [Aspergillus oleicola]